MIINSCLQIGANLRFQAEIDLWVPEANLFTCVGTLYIPLRSSNCTRHVRNINMVMAQLKCQVCISNTTLVSGRNVLVSFHSSNPMYFVPLSVPAEREVLRG